jgi:hypothetical protein
MANQNPISLKSDGTFVDFKIPIEELQNDIQVSINVELLDEGWTYDSDNILTLQGHPDDLYNDDLPPDKQSIGIGQEIVEKKFRAYSRISRIRDGAADNKPSRVKYTITFYADGKQIDEFEKECDQTNPENFIANLKFK